MSPQGRFENTLTGMMEALAEIKGKGDLMMGAIRGQRELLFDVRGEVREAEERLAVVERQRKEEEKMMREAKSKRIMAEARTRFVYHLKRRRFASKACNICLLFLHLSKASEKNTWI